jgi:hypothetical protein
MRQSFAKEVKVVADARSLRKMEDVKLTGRQARSKER